MSDREPVDIMGVFAFPNPDKDNRDIRFICEAILEAASSSLQHGGPIRAIS